MSNILIPTDVYQKVLYSSGELINGNLTYNVAIKLVLNSDGSLQQPIDIIVQSLLTDSVTYNTLVYGTNYTAIPILNGIQVTLLQTITNCEYLIFARNTTANYNIDFTGLTGFVLLSQLNQQFLTSFSAIQDLQAYAIVHNEFTQGLAPLTYVNAQLALKANLSLLGQANGIATLGPDGQVPSSQLPTALIDGLPQGLWNASTISFQWQEILICMG